MSFNGFNSNNNGMSLGNGINNDDRVYGVKIYRPILYGNIAYKKPISDSIRNQHQWFTWTVYVRGLYNEDLSYFIKKVVFILDKDFENYGGSLRVIDKPPFELTEEGWGQFNIKIHIYFHDCTSTTVSIRNNSNSNKNLNNNVKRSYDLERKEDIEMIYNDMLLDAYKKQKRYGMDMKDKRKKAQSAGKIKKINKKMNIDDAIEDSLYENKIELIHRLMLFENENKPVFKIPNYIWHNNNKPIFSEKYVELVFKDPTKSFYNRIIDGSKKYLDNHKNCNYVNTTPIIQDNEQQLINNIVNQHQKLMKKFAALKKRYNKLSNQ